MQTGIAVCTLDPRLARQCTPDAGDVPENHWRAQCGLGRGWGEGNTQPQGQEPLGSGDGAMEACVELDQQLEAIMTKLCPDSYRERQLPTATSVL